MDRLRRSRYLDVRRWRAGVARRLGVLAQLRSAEDALLFLRIFLFVAAVSTLVRLKLIKLPALPPPKRSSIPPDPNRVQKIAAYVDTARSIGWPLVSRACLTRGLTLYHFLRGAGLDVSLAFGVGNVGEAFSGHCWLVRDGEPFLEHSDPRVRFTVVFSLPRGVPTTSGPS